jgi:hypothetical protein
LPILAHAADKPALIVWHKRKSFSLVNDANKAIMKDWLFNKCEDVSASPNQNDNRYVCDPLTGEKFRKQNYLYQEGFQLRTKRRQAKRAMAITRF